ncbi:MAG: hypothetical protein AB7F50_03740 [Fimbriimonadaceae bacterium]
MKNWILALCGLVLVGGMTAHPIASVAQDGGFQDKTIDSLELEQADIRDAVKLLFKQVDGQYTISNEVQGTVTASFKSVPFQTALRGLLNQVNATYRIEGGIYNIIPRPSENPDVGTTPNLGAATGSTTTPLRRIKIRSADPALIVAILSGTADIQTYPETSTFFGGGGGGFGGGSGGFSGGFGGGSGGFSGGFGGGSGGFSGGFGGGSGGFGGGSGGFGGGGFGGGFGG